MLCGYGYIRSLFKAGPLRHYFSSNTVRLLAWTSLQLETQSENDQSVTNQKEYTGWDKILIFSVHVYL